MANEFVARKGIISLGDLTIDTLSGNNGAIITLDADGKLTAGSTGTGIFSGSAQVDHDATTNFVANEHINHANVSVNAGSGLTGGGTIASTRTINVATANNGIVINADSIELATGSTTFTGGVKSKLNTDSVISGSVQVSHDSTTGFVANEHINHTSVTLTAAKGLTGGGDISTGRSFAVGQGTGILVNDDDVAIDYAGTDNFILSATDGTSLGNLEGGDKIAFVDLDNSVKYASVSQLPFTANVGDITGVTAGSGLTGGGTSGAVTLNVVSGNNGIVVNADNITLTTSSTTFTGGVKSKMSADAVVSGSATQVRTFLNVADGANNYTHPNHSGDVTSSGDGATTLAAAAITGKTALTSGLVSTDEFLVSDAGTLKRMDTSVLQTYMQSNLTFTTNTDVDVSVANLTTRLAEIPGNATIGGGSSTITIPGDLVVTGTTTTNNVETVSTSNGVIFEGNAADTNELTLLAGTLTADQTVTLPDATGTVALTSNIGNATITIGSGNGLTGGAAFTTNQAGNETITLNVGAGDGISVAANTVAVDATVLRTTGGNIVSGSAQIDHDATTNFVANEHINHANVSVTAGNGLTGGGTIAATRTINVVSGNNGIVVNADDITLATASTTFTGGVKSKLDADGVISGSVQIDHDATTNFVANEHINHANVSITAGNGLTGGGTIASTRTINVGAGDGISVAADTVAVNSTVIRTTGNQSMSGTKTFTGKVVLDTDSGDDVDLFTDFTSTVAGAGATTTIASYTSAAAVAVYFDYRINDATTNLRAGTVMAVSNGTTVAYTEYSTGDIGDTSAVTLSVDYSGGAIRLRALNNAGNYRANVFVRTV